MKENETFTMTYSAEQQEEVQAIRDKYLPPREDKLEQLRKMDQAVAGKATMRSICLGVVGTLILGAGMSLMMSDFGSALGALAMPVGIGIGVVGLAILACAYPLYQHTLKKERQKIAPEVLKLTEELLK